MSSGFLGFGDERALRHIADRAGDGVFTTDAEGRITYWNEAAQRILGWTPEEAVGARCSLLAGDAVDGCARGGGPSQCGLAMQGRSAKRCAARTKDGRPIVILKNAVLLVDGDGAHVGALEAFTRVAEPAAAIVGPRCAGLAGNHPAMLELYRTIQLVAFSDATVLVIGESGAGKSRVAEAIHTLGPRASRTLVRVRCADVDAQLADEGAGHADAGRVGSLFDEAAGGTLLLEEIGDLGARAQLALLRELERRDAARAGTGREPAEARVLCTTSLELRDAVERDEFRAKLFFRLSAFPVRVPPLREHVEDVLAIGRHLLHDRAPAVEIAVETGYALAAYRWPGNVRELQNVLEYAALRSGGRRILPEHLPPELREPPAPFVDGERARLAQALARCGGNRALAARALGISRVTLWRWMRKYGVLE